MGASSLGMRLYRWSLLGSRHDRQIREVRGEALTSSYVSVEYRIFLYAHPAIRPQSHRRSYRKRATDCGPMQPRHHKHQSSPRAPGRLQQATASEVSLPSYKAYPSTRGFTQSWVAAFVETGNVITPLVTGLRWRSSSTILAAAAIVGRRIWTVHSVNW